jgi:hypothetical protein
MSTATAPARYEELERMPIAGEWRSGSSGDSRADIDPWLVRRLGR